MNRRTLLALIGLAPVMSVAKAAAEPVGRRVIVGGRPAGRICCWAVWGPGIPPPGRWERPTLIPVDD